MAGDERRSKPGWSLALLSGTQEWVVVTICVVAGQKIAFGFQARDKPRPKKKQGWECPAPTVEDLAVSFLGDACPF